MKTTMPSIHNCALCEEAAIQVHCKLCKAWLYCSKDCSKKDTKKHKKVCSKFASAIKQKKADGLPPEEVPNFFKHVRHLYFLKPTSTATSETGASGPSGVGGAGPSAAISEAKQTSRHYAAVTQAAASIEGKLELARSAAAAAAEEKTELARAVASAEADVEAKKAAKAAGLREVRGLKPAKYGDPAFWEKRFAKSRPGSELYEWYVDYPGAALRQAFPQSVRDKRMLVIGCGNSQLSERMCQDGFRDVESVDTSKSAIAQMSARTPRFDRPGTKCRYTVMDAAHLTFDTSTFSGVVDKGTVDAVLTAGMKKTRLICAEAMRVLEPGGKFVVVSSSGEKEYQDNLLGMCGPGSACGSPLPAPVSDPGLPPAFIYVVCKPLASRSEAVVAAAAPADAGQTLSPPRVQPWPRGEGVGTAFELGQRGAHPGKVGGGDSGDRNISKDGGVARSVDGSPVATFANGGPRPGSPLPVEEAPAPGLLGTDLAARDGCAVPAARPEAARHPSNGGGPDDAGGGDVGRRREGPLQARRPSAAAAEEVIKTVQDLGTTQEQINALVKRIKKLKPEDAAVPSPPAPLEPIPSAPPALRVPPAQVPSQSGDGGGPLSSLPWGSREKFDEDIEFANYDLIFGSEIRTSEVAVEIAATRLKICLRRRADAGEEVVLDRELHRRADPSESTWSIQDKTVLSVSLCKRVPAKWGRVFKSSKPEPPPAAPRWGGGAGEVEAKARGLVSGNRWRESLVPIEGLPSPSPPALPRGHERSPKSAVFDTQKFKTPERFFLEDLTGIQKFRLHISKPPGFKVDGWEVCGLVGTVCEICLRCRDESGCGLPNANLRVFADFGREDFDIRGLKIEAEVAGELCVVRVPYGTASADGRDSGGGHASSGVGVSRDSTGSSDMDDEGVSRIARVRCRFCGHPLTAAGGGSGLAARAMPSGRWDDCIEDMICFDGPSATPMLARDVNYASPGRCLMGHAEVLLHSRDIVEGAVALVDDSAVEKAVAVAAMAAAVDGDGKPPPREGDSAPSIDEEGQDLWRSVECARCDLPLGRPATLVDGRNDAEDRGFLLLKHCLLADEVGAASGGSRGDGDEVAGKSDLVGRRGEGAVSGAGGGKGGAPSVPRVFENRTVITWLMGEMEHSNSTDGCTRYIVAARARARTAPASCLSLLLVGTHDLVSEDGGQRPRRAHRIGFREESREQAEKAHEDEEERAGGSQGEEAGTGGGGEDVRKRAVGARVPARVLEVSYGEYGKVRRRLLETAWVSSATVAATLSTLDSRGYSYSYLF